jgi:hypothetical protein
MVIVSGDDIKALAMPRSNAAVLGHGIYDVDCFHAIRCTKSPM